MKFRLLLWFRWYWFFGVSMLCMTWQIHQPWYVWNSVSSGTFLVRVRCKFCYICLLSSYIVYEIRLWFHWTYSCQPYYSVPIFSKLFLDIIFYNDTHTISFPSALYVQHNHNSTVTNNTVFFFQYLWDLVCYSFHSETWPQWWNSPTAPNASRAVVNQSALGIKGSFTNNEVCVLYLDWEITVLFQYQIVIKRLLQNFTYTNEDDLWSCKCKIYGNQHHVSE